LSVKLKITEMKKSGTSSIFVLLGILLASIFSSCTTDMKKSQSDYIEKDYNVESFNRIKFEGAYNVKLIQGEKPAIVMTTTEQLHEKVKIRVDNNVLYIKSKINHLGTDDIKLTITVKDLEDIKIEGGVFLTSIGVLELKDLNLTVEGSAYINLKLNAEQLRARASGGVNMEFEGKTDRFYAISEGAGNIDADHLESKIVECRVSGVGNASVYATEKLDATVEGLGKIGYRGDPSVNKQVNGIGMIYRK
jgi:hypothetical protein